jgi:hypothetical protein
VNGFGNITSLKEEEKRRHRNAQDNTKRWEEEETRRTRRQETSRVLRFRASAWDQARVVKSRMNNSHAFANRTGASALIIYKIRKW